MCIPSPTPLFAIDRSSLMRSSISHINQTSGSCDHSSHHIVIIITSHALAQLAVRPNLGCTCGSVRPCALCVCLCVFVRALTIVRDKRLCGGPFCQSSADNVVRHSQRKTQCTVNALLTCFAHTHKQTHKYLEHRVHE